MSFLYSSAPFFVMIPREIFDNAITECNAPVNSTGTQPPLLTNPGNFPCFSYEWQIPRGREHLNDQMPSGGDESRGQMQSLNPMSGHILTSLGRGEKTLIIPHNFVIIGWACDSLAPDQ